MASKDVDEMSDKMRRNLKRKLETRKYLERDYSEKIESDKSESEQVADKPGSSSSTDIIIRYVPTTDSEVESCTTSKLQCNICEEGQKEKELINVAEKQKQKLELEKLKGDARVLELEGMTKKQDEASKAKKLKSDVLKDEKKEKELLRKIEMQEYINQKFKLQLNESLRKLRLLELRKLEQELKELREKITDVMVGKYY